MGNLTKDFSKSEFKCNCGTCIYDGSQIDIDLVRKLQKIRNELGKPMKINSGIRCEYWNNHEDGEEFSQHLPKMGCRASDIAVTNHNDRVLIVAKALCLGLSVGVYSWGIHLDNRCVQAIF